MPIPGFAPWLLTFSKEFNFPLWLSAWLYLSTSLLLLAFFLLLMSCLFLIHHSFYLYFYFYELLHNDTNQRHQLKPLKGEANNIDHLLQRSVTMPWETLCHVVMLILDTYDPPKHCRKYTLSQRQRHFSWSAASARRKMCQKLLSYASKQDKEPNIDLPLELLWSQSKSASGQCSRNGTIYRVPPCNPLGPKWSNASIPAPTTNTPGGPVSMFWWDHIKRKVRQVD